MGAFPNACFTFCRIGGLASFSHGHLLCHFLIHNLLVVFFVAFLGSLLFSSHSLFLLFPHKFCSSCLVKGKAASSFNSKACVPLHYPVTELTVVESVEIFQNYSVELVERRAASITC